MTTATTYLLDASPLIQAKRTYYGFDFCPAFWDALVRGHEQGRVFSIDRVKAELDPGKDELTNWADNVAPAAFFLDSKTRTVANEFAPLMEWVQSQDQFFDAAKNEFARTDIADGWLIATAKAHGMTVVTHE